nr:hypothetical protein [Candidatus Sigynarchaeum springense]
MCGLRAFPEIVTRLLNLAVHLIAKRRDYGDDGGRIVEYRADPAVI